MNAKQPKLSAIADEVARQPRILGAYLDEVKSAAPPGSLFVGAGDSYTAANIASRLSSIRHLAIDPYELISEEEVAAGKTVYFVTVSGNTASGISAAKAAKGIAERRIAITANAKGKIADVVDKVIFIPYDYVPKLPGMLSFSLSLLTLLKLSSGPLECDFHRVDIQAKRDSRKLLFSDFGTTYLLGNSAAFPIGQYSALKISEVLGARAQAERLEEFAHAPIFSISKSDVINIFCAFDSLHVGQKLANSLNKRGFEATAIPSYGSNRFERVFYLIFLAQLAVLQKAKSLGRSRPYFVGAKGKLAVSDSMIY